MRPPPPPAVQLQGRSAGWSMRRWGTPRARRGCTATVRWACRPAGQAGHTGWHFSTSSPHPACRLRHPTADPRWGEMQQAADGGQQAPAPSAAAYGVAGPGAARHQHHESFDFGPMVAAPGAGGRTSTGELAEVAIDDAAAGAAEGGAAKAEAKPPAPGRRPSIQLTVDGRAQGLQAGPVAPLSVAAPAPAPAGRAREDSGGLDYSPDSRAVMARINRWWKNFDEGYMQPKFGGPASRGNSSANLQGLAPGAAGGGAAGVQASKPSFAVPGGGRGCAWAAAAAAAASAACMQVVTAPAPAACSEPPRRMTIRRQPKPCSNTTQP